MAEENGNNAALLGNPAVSPLIDADEPTTAKAEVKADPAPAAEDNKADRPDATDENADPGDKEHQKQSRRQRKLQIERDARIRAETRAEIAERALAERAKAPAVTAVAEPKREDFDSDDAFLKAFIRHEAKQELAEGQKTEREAQQRREAQSKTQAAHQAVADEWTKLENDFKLKVPTFEDDIEDFLEADIGKFPPVTRQAIVEFGPEILHHLGTHPEVVAEILKLSPARQVAALGKIDVSGGPGSDADAEEEIEAPAPRPRAPEPPPPARHVRQGSSAPAGLSDDMDVYVQQRRKQGARWAR